MGPFSWLSGEVKEEFSGDRIFFDTEGDDGSRVRIFLREERGKGGIVAVAEMVISLTTVTQDAFNETPNGIEFVHERLSLCDEELGDKDYIFQHREKNRF